MKARLSKRLIYWAKLWHLRRRHINSTFVWGVPTRCRTGGVRRESALRRPSVFAPTKWPQRRHWPLPLSREVLSTRQPATGVVLSPATTKRLGMGRTTRSST